MSLSGKEAEKGEIVHRPPVGSHTARSTRGLVAPVRAQEQAANWIGRHGIESLVLSLSFSFAFLSLFHE